MIVALTGGTGGAKLVEGLHLEIDPNELLVVCNTADDLEVHGLYVAPDLDTVTYTLAGIVDRAKGWGIREETFAALGQLGRLGEETWFQLGDQDLATHLLRTRWLRQGETLTQVTARISQALGVRARIVPMSDDRVATRVRTHQGEISFQEYFVRDRWSQPVEGMRLAGIERSRPAPGILEGIREAKGIIVCPSNPATSIGPILAVPGIREALREARAPTVAVSPMVQRRPFSGPAHKFMEALGMEASSVGIAKAYRDFLDWIVIEGEDAPMKERIEPLGVRARAALIRMENIEDKRRLARDVLTLLGL